MTIKDSPHANLTRRLRHDFRELRDIARHTEMTALCVAAMSSHRSIDVMQMSDEVSRLLSTALEQKAPYYGDKNDAKDNTNRFDEYFKQLAEMQKEMNASNKPADNIDMKAEARDETAKN